MLVTAERADVPAIFDTVWRFHGYDEDERYVVFGVDHRIAHDLHDRILDQGSVDCEVEPWQILQRGSIAPVYSDEERIEDEPHDIENNRY